MAFEIEGKITALDKDYPRPTNWTWFCLRDDYGNAYHISGITHTQLYVGADISCSIANGKVYKGEQQYILTSTIKYCLKSKRDVVNYLSSDCFHGIGVAIASRIYDIYGRNTLDMIKNNIDIVKSTCKLTDKQANSLFDGVTRIDAENVLTRTFPSMSSNMIHKLLEQHNGTVDSLVNSIQKYPYNLLHNGFSLQDVDNIVINDLHWALDNVTRLAHIFEWGVKKCIQYKNSTYVNLSDNDDFYGSYNNGYCDCKGIYGLLFLKAKRPFVMPDNVDDVWFCDKLEDVLKETFLLKKEMFFNSVTNTWESHLYTKSMWEARNYIVEFVRREVHMSDDMRKIYSCGNNRYKQWLNYKQNHMNLKLNLEQQKALNAIYKQHVSFVTGGPGRGKTTLASAIIDSWKYVFGVGASIVCLAPTGKAVNKLKNDTHYNNTGTIARFLVKNKDNDASTVVDFKGENMSIPSETLILIDEVSMLNYEEAANLLRLVDSCNLVFMGDVNQLPPIELGAFFNDVKSLNVFSMNYLTQNMRTDVTILGDNADKILDGTLSPKDYDEHFGFDFTPIQGLSMADADAISVDKVIGYYQDALQRGYSISDILLMTPANGGTLGVTRLNEKLQDIVNPLFDDDIMQYKKKNKKYTYVVRKGLECPNVKLGDISVRIMDRVMNTKNDVKATWYRYENDNIDGLKLESGSGIFNGDSGVIERYIFGSSLTNPKVVVHMDDGRFFEMDVTDFQKNFTVSYAITVHKAQGSEASVVILALSECSTMWAVNFNFLTKNLLYTGVTRAKKEVQIVGSKNAFDLCMNTNQILSKSTLYDDVMAVI